MYIYIYRLHWVFIAIRGHSLFAASRGYSGCGAQAFCGVYSVVEQGSKAHMLQ